MTRDLVNRMRDKLAGSRRWVALGLPAVIAVVGITLALGGDDPQKSLESGDGGQAIAGQPGASQVRPTARDGSAGKAERPTDGNTKNVKPAPSKPGVSPGGTAELDSPAGRPVAGASGGTADLKPGPSTQPVGEIAEPDLSPDRGKKGLPPGTDRGEKGLPPTEDRGDRRR